VDIKYLNIAGLDYHALKISSCTQEDIEIFSQADVIKLKPKYGLYLVNRKLFVNINDLLLKDKQGNLSVLKDKSKL
jgi:hypothetical protein